MGKLSLKPYVLKCILGGEVAYFICLFFGYTPFRTERGIELHHSLFETLPGFVWGNVGSIVLGAVYMLIFSVIFGSYMVWMHNSSMAKA